VQIRSDAQRAEGSRPFRVSPTFYSTQYNLKHCTTMAKKTKQGKRKAPPAGAVDGNWLSSLVQQSGPAIVPTKAERIEKRLAKKQRRQERQAPVVQHQWLKDETPGNITSQSNRKNIKFLAKYIETCIADFDIKKRNIFVSNEPKGKAVVWKKWTEESVQPRRRDYGGLGLARPSMFLTLSDPSFMPRLEQEFQEHIPGFFGKQRTKAMKKQLDGNMLWRQLAEKRHTKVNGRKLSDMNPDERVEAMIAAGHL
jgi:hypothetical protein